MPAISKNPPKDSIVLKCHVGGTLHNLARYYPTMADVVDELIQNALDAEATEIFLRIRANNRYLSIRDNGVGMSREKFNDKVSQSIGLSLKSKNKVGQFGIGFISPVGKCDHFTVTSCPKPKTDEYYTWTFRVKPKDDDPEIPCKKESHITYAPDQVHTCSGQNVWWRTEVQVHGYVADEAMSSVTVHGIVESALMKYSTVMEQQGTRLKIEVTNKDGTVESETVTAATFTGQKLPEKKYDGDKAGRVTIRMYVSRRLKKTKSSRINIKFGEEDNDFRFPFSAFRNSTAGEILPKEIIDALGSGIFEGEILAQKVKLSPSRTCFEKSDALIDLCVCIEKWFDEEGKKYMDSEQSQRKHERYQEAGLKAMKMVDKILKDLPNPEDLRDSLDNYLKQGMIGQGHVKIQGVKQDEKSLSPEGGAGKTREKRDGDGKDRPDESMTEKDKTHLSVTGPKGSYRKITKNGTAGLQYAYTEMPHSQKLWHLNQENGIIIFNTMHPIWVKLDDKASDIWISCLMEYVTLQILSLIQTPEEFRPQARVFSDKSVEFFASWLKFGGAMPSKRRFITD